MAKTGRFQPSLIFPPVFITGRRDFPLPTATRKFIDGLADHPAPVVNGAPSIGNGISAGLSAGDSVPDVLWLQTHTSAAM